MSQVTEILSAMDAGDTIASAELLPLIYDELRRLATQRISQEKPGQTIQATALVHEAYIRLVDGDKNPNWNSRGHFFAAAAEAMRRILVEIARRKQAEKHGGDRLRVELPEGVPVTPAGIDNILDLNEAISRLEEHDQAAASLVKLRYFAGMDHGEAAQVLGISRGAADRLWTLARTWLYRQLSK
jgi:RNA polymerase sigma factor (TIGR02999 family)